MRIICLIRLLVFVLPLVLLAACAETPKKSNDLPVYCLDKPKAGQCSGNTPGFYYDYPSDTCRAFKYGNCHGPISFTSRDSCEQACVARGK
jgi:hypothetical protein